MKEIPFSIPVSGVMKIEDDKLTLTIQQAEINISFDNPPQHPVRFKAKDGKKILDIVLEVARELDSGGKPTLTAAEMYAAALVDYPSMKWNSWNAHVIACAPNHPSYQHHKNRRDYLTYWIDKKTYRLNQEYKKQ